MTSPPIVTHHGIRVYPIFNTCVSLKGQCGGLNYSAPLLILFWIPSHSCPFSNSEGSLQWAVQYNAYEGTIMVQPIMVWYTCTVHCACIVQCTWVYTVHAMYTVSSSLTVYIWQAHYGLYYYYWVVHAHLSKSFV